MNTQVHSLIVSTNSFDRAINGMSPCVARNLVLSTINIFYIISRIIRVCVCVYSHNGLLASIIIFHWYHPIKIIFLFKATHKVAQTLTYLDYMFSDSSSSVFCSKLFNSYCHLKSKFSFCSPSSY